MACDKLIYDPENIKKEEKKKNEQAADRQQRAEKVLVSVRGGTRVTFLELEVAS